MDPDAPGGDRAGIPLLQARLHTHSTIHSYRRDLAGIEPATSEPVRQRSYLWATGLLWRSVKELLFDSLPVCELCFSNKAVKVCGIWTRVSITASSSEMCVYPLDHHGFHVEFWRLCVFVGWDQFKVSNSGVWTRVSITASSSQTCVYPLDHHGFHVDFWRLSVFVGWDQFKVSSSGIWTQVFMIKTQRLISCTTESEELLEILNRVLLRDLC